MAAATTITTTTPEIPDHGDGEERRGSQHDQEHHDISPELLANLGFYNAADLEALRGFVGRPLGVMATRRSTRGERGRYPALVEAGLEAVKTVNNGDCFFSAISDQLYGNDSHTAEFRALAVQHIIDEKDRFRPFIAVKRGGGTREVRKRKNAGGYSVSIDHGAASEEAVDLQFYNRMREMARPGTYAEQHEIWALAAILRINIRIFSPDGIRDTDESGKRRPVAAVAYDPIAQHYSSVRRIGDPRTGPAFIEGCYEPPSISIESPQQQASPARTFLSSSEFLHPEQFARSRSSTPGSISIQRDDDDEVSSSHSPKRTSSVRKIRTTSSRKPSNLSKRVSAATPSTQPSREPSPPAVVATPATTNDEVEIMAASSTPPPQRNDEDDQAEIYPNSAAKSLPSPPSTQSNSSSKAPSVIVILDSENEGSEEEEEPISPKEAARRRRSSARARDTSLAHDENENSGAEAAQARGPSPEPASRSIVAGENPKKRGRRALRRGLRGSSPTSKTTTTTTTTT